MVKAELEFGHRHVSFYTLQNKVLPRQNLHISRICITVQHGGTSRSSRGNGNLYLYLKKEQYQTSMGV
jgi:hypothetical protein